MDVSLSDPGSNDDSNFKFYKTVPPYKAYYKVDVETTTETCPSFYDSFANAFAFTAQIEMVITLILVLVFKKTGVIKMNEDMIAGQKSSSKTIIATAGTVVAGLLSTVVVILMKMPG